MVWVSVGLAVRDSNVSKAVYSAQHAFLFIYEMKKYILHLDLAVKKIERATLFSFESGATTVPNFTVAQHHDRLFEVI